MNCSKQLFLIIFSNISCSIISEYQPQGPTLMERWLSSLSPLTECKLNFVSTFSLFCPCGLCANRFYIVQLHPDPVTNTSGSLDCDVISKDQRQRKQYSNQFLYRWKPLLLPLFLRKFHAVLTFYTLTFLQTRKWLKSLMFLERVFLFSSYCFSVVVKSRNMIMKFMQYGKYINKYLLSLIFLWFSVISHWNTLQIL